MKRGLLILLLLAAVACASSIPRYNDFPLDNIHILRLQEASRSLGGNVSELKVQQQVYHEQQQKNLADLRANMRAFQTSMLSQMNQIRNTVKNASITAAVPVETIPAPPPPPVIEKEEGIPPYFIALLGLNIFLLIVVIILIFWLREQYQTHEKKLKKDHIHPAPDKLVDYVQSELDSGISTHDVRLELAGKGWSPSMIEHAIHAAKER